VLNVVCTIHLVQALRVARDLHLNYWVYDMLEGKCVHIVLKELNFWFYSNNPCKSVRLYTLANSIVWPARKTTFGLAHRSILRRLGVALAAKIAAWKHRLL
tara:strand:- start:264 stop:566 length:303 start_codon:yes stop_codon:yes gene_type:complete